MTVDRFTSALILTGPTGSGKSTLSLDLADHLNAEIISMDSMALYRGMDIISAKPDVEAQRRIPHHLLDVLDPWESSSVAWWLERASEIVDDIQSRGRQPLFVGGTPLYLKAMLRGLFEGPPADELLRQQLLERAGELYDELKEVDPPSAEKLHPNDQKRIVRALEVDHLPGTPISQWQKEWESEASREEQGRIRCLCVNRPREELYARINLRVLGMIDGGLIDEVKTLRDLPQPLSREASQAVGYFEVCAFLDDKISQDDMIERIQRRSRQYAKRQLTWFRNLPECEMVEVNRVAELWSNQ